MYPLRPIALTLLSAASTLLSAAHRLRPNGAMACSHGCSAAQPVDPTHHPAPPWQGRSKSTPTNTRATRKWFQPTRPLDSLMQRPRAALAAPLPARKSTSPLAWNHPTMRSLLARWMNSALGHWDLSGGR
jgi:hypothetical protein